ncbi:ribose ABC transporter permease [candidate division KSB1 bacterium]|nr:ribose ABC transporter permease [candidate division KSB1 bacterium]
MPQNRYKEILQKSQSLFALLLMIVLMTILTDNFFTTGNFWNVLRQISVNLCISVGMTLVILTGGIDLSVGSVLALTGAVTAGLLKNGIAIEPLNILIRYNTFGAVSAGLFLGLILGLFNGVVITRFKVAPFVVTLGMLTIARGLTMLWTGGYPITGLGKFSVIGTGWFLGIPLPVWVTGIVVGIFMIIMRKTRFGRYVYAIGGNEQASHLSGLNVKRVKIIVYAICGLLSAVAAVIVTARLDSAQPNAGISYELDAIAAVVVGGTSLSGGRGSIAGTVLGALIIGVLNNGLVLLNVSPFWQQVVKGFVIIVAVVIDRSNKSE